MKEENYWCHRLAHTKIALKSAVASPPPPPPPLPPSFTFRQLQIQLRQLVSNLFWQGGQIHAAVCHDSADKHECCLAENEVGCRQRVYKKNKNKTPSLKTQNKHQSRRDGPSARLAPPP